MALYNCRISMYGELERVVTVYMKMTSWNLEGVRKTMKNPR
jgi:hypothetical protein